MRHGDHPADRALRSTRFSLCRRDRLPVILFRTDEPAANITAPSGALDGQRLAITRALWADSSERLSRRNFFISATHIGQAGAEFSFPRIDLHLGQLLSKIQIAIC